MRIAELVTAIVLAILSIYFMWKSGTSSWGDGWGESIRYLEGEGPGSGFWPFYLSAVMLLCCVWITVNWVRRASPPSRSIEKYLDAYGIVMLIKVGGGVTAFIGLIHFIGMYGAMTVFLIYYIYFLGKHSLVTALSIAFATPVVTFFFFDVAMRIVLPKGYLEPLFIPLYDIFL
ncbi:MAG: tripartite tricarboxylate transporter TctB family protein [Paracoccaceae bacterium]|nr:tripartite tricarboxylate transporter TctB family protein [Paracoccaceae bacterium]